MIQPKLAEWNLEGKDQDGKQDALENADLSIKAKPVAIENACTNDGMHQVIGQCHTSDRCQQPAEGLQFSPV